MEAGTGGGGISAGAQAGKDRANVNSTLLLECERDLGIFGKHRKAGAFRRASRAETGENGEWQRERWHENERRIRKVVRNRWNRYESNRMMRPFQRLHRLKE